MFFVVDVGSTTTISPTIRLNLKPTPRPTSIPTRRPTRAPSIDDPSLLSWDFNRGFGLFTLYFDRLVDASTFDPSSLTIYPNVTVKTNNTMTFSDTYNDLSDQGNVTTLKFYILASEYSHLMFNPVYRLSTGIYLSMQRGAVLSNIGHPNIEINTTHPMHSSAYTMDTLNPYLVLYWLDMNTGNLTLKFSEPMNPNPSKISLSGLTLQIKKNAYMSGVSVNLLNNGSSIITYSDYNRLISMSIGNINLNLIKAQPGLCVDIDSTYVSIWKSFAVDLSDNTLSLNGYDKLYGMQAVSYSPDITPPTLSSWSIDLNSGLLVLQFSETINIKFFNYTSCKLSTDPRNATVFNRTILQIETPSDGDGLAQDFNSDSVSITLSSDQLDAIKSNDNLCHTGKDCFLVLDYNLVRDMASDANIYQGIDATLTSPKIVTTYIVDTTQPQIISYTLDMTTQLLSIKFSEVVKASSVVLNGLTIQSSKLADSTTESLQFSNSTLKLITTKDSTLLNFYIKSAGFNIIKSKEFLARSSSKLYLACRNFFVFDKSIKENQVVVISTASALINSGYTPDYNSPTLIAWVPDMSYDRILLKFSEPVNTTIFNPSVIKLSSEASSDSYVASVTLGKLSYVYSYSLNLVTIQLSQVDADAVKSQPPLCTSNTSCYISFTTALTYDTASYSNASFIIQNKVIATTYSLCTEFSRDTIPPKLVQFILDMAARTVYLLFTEITLTQYFDPSGISLSTDTDRTISANMTAYGLSDSENSNNVTIKLPLADYSIIKLAYPIALSSDTTYITLSSIAVSDMAGNAISGVYGSTTNILQAYSVVPDTVIPQLKAIYRNSTNNRLTLYFDDVLIISSLDLYNIFITSDTGSKDYLGKAQLLTTGLSGNLVFALTSMQLRLSELLIAYSQDSTNAYIAKEGAVLDTPNRNPNAKMSSSSAIREGLTFLSFRLNMSSRAIVLELAFPMTLSSINPLYITLMSTSDSTLSYTLKSIKSYSFLGPTFLQLEMTSTDHSSIQQTITPLQYSKHIKIVITKNAMVDINQKNLASLLTLSCSQLVTDKIPPTISSFTLDLSLNLLKIEFSEAVLLSSLMISRIYLIDSNGGDYDNIISLADVIYTPTSSSNYATSVSIPLNSGSSYPTVKDRIQLTNSIGLSIRTTYLIASTGFAGDSATPINYMTAISKTNAIEASSVIADTVKPALISYLLNMNSRILSLTFNKAVNLSSNIPNYYFFLEQPTNPLSNQYTITNANTSIPRINSTVSYTVTMYLSKYDVDSIMHLAPHLLLSSSNSYLGFKAGAIRDISSTPNYVDAQLFRYGFPPTTFIPDITPPLILAVDISIQDSTVDFYFNEVVNCTSVDTTKIILQYASFVGLTAFKYTLTTSTKADCTNYLVYDQHIHLDMGLDDLTSIKSTIKLAKQSNTTYIRLASNAFTDAAGNSITSIPDGSAVRVRIYIGDTVSPNLLGFTISSQRELTLLFDEPVNIGNIKISSLSFQDRTPLYTKSYSLATSTLLSVSTKKISLNLALGTDFDRIKTDSKIFGAQNYTWLRVASTFITDTSGNPLTAISSTNALALGPTIQTWDLDMNAGVLLAVFSEEVNYNFSFAGVGIQISSSANNISYTLQTPSFVSRIGISRTSLYKRLSNTDINNIKFLRLATSKKTAYLTNPYGMTRSVSAGTIFPNLYLVEIRNYRPLPVRNYYKDVTPPFMYSFQLNLNSGTLMLSFNEPISTTSVDVTKITLYSSLVGSSAKISSTYRNVTLHNLTFISIAISGYDLSDLKVAFLKGGSLDNLIMTDSGAKDFAGNAYTGNDEDSPVVLSHYTPDTTPPILKTIKLDLSLGFLTIVFDEYVDFAKLFPTNFTISSNENPSSVSTHTVPLTEFSVIQRGIDGSVIIDMSLYTIDLDSLKSSIYVGINISTSFISMAGVFDIFGNHYSNVKAKQVTTFIDDTVYLELESFDIFIDTTTSKYLVYMKFSKGVRISTFRCSDFKFRSDPINIPRVSFQLSDSECSVETLVDGDVVQFLVTNTSRFSGLIGNYVDSTYVNIPNIGNTKDLYGNKLNVKYPIFSLRKGTCVTKFILDMNNGILSLIFSNKIQRFGKFQPWSFGIYSSVSKSVYYLSSDYSNLEGLSLTSPSNSSLGLITLSKVDIDSLKRLDLDVSNTYLVAEDEAVYDVFGRPIAIIDDRSKLKISKLILDTIRPYVTNITIDLGLEILILKISEPLRDSSVKVTNFRIQSKENSFVNSLKLTGGKVTMDSFNNLRIAMLSADAASIKSTIGLAKNISSTFISFTFQSAADFAGNYLLSVATSKAKGLDVDTGYIGDTIQPTVQSFTLDMMTGLITIKFSEPIIIATIDPAQITFQSRYLSSDGSAYTLTGGTISYLSSTQVYINLLDIDIRGMKASYGLVRTKQSSYLRISSTFAEDLNHNSIVAIRDGLALACTSFVTDSKPPTVLSTVLNMDAFTLTLTMSEVIPIASIDVTALSLQTNATKVTSTKYYSLHTSSKISQVVAFNDILVITLSQSDLNSLKSRYPLLTNTSYTYISVFASFLSDVYGNVITPILTSLAKQIDTIYTDTVSPSIVNYDLDMSNGKVSLQFSEAILSTSLNLSQITLQSAITRRFGYYANLSSSEISIGIDYDSIYVDIIFNDDLFSYLKYYSIGITGYLTWSNVFVADSFGNYLPPRWDSSVLGFTPLLSTSASSSSDTLSPNLLRWYFNRLNMTMIMIFDEPVTLANANSISIVNTAKNSLTGQPLPSLPTVTTVSYEMYNTKLTLVIPDFCPYIWSSGGSNVSATCSLTSSSLSSSSFLSIANSSYSYLYMTLKTTAFYDFAEEKNAVNEVSMVGKLKETGPDCSLCSFGQFVSKNCTANSDRVCSTCSTCSDGKYMQAACSSYDDIHCKVCDACQFGEYISSSCGTNGENTGCSTCTKCTGLTYELQSCANGIDTVCGSCRRCSFQQYHVSDICITKGWMWWNLLNCCYDQSGALQPCNYVDRVNMFLKTLDGRHHWVFDGTSPPVDDAIYNFPNNY